MTDTYTTIDHFPAGTPEATIERIRDRNLSNGAVTSEYAGDQNSGWTLVTKWPTAATLERFHAGFEQSEVKGKRKLQRDGKTPASPYSDFDDGAWMLVSFN